MLKQSVRLILLYYNSRDCGVDEVQVEVNTSCLLFQLGGDAPSLLFKETVMYY
jgi:hypothetical protein